MLTRRVNVGDVRIVRFPARASRCSPHTTEIQLGHGTVQRADPERVIPGGLCLCRGWAGCEAAEVLGDGIVVAAVGGGPALGVPEA